MNSKTESQHLTPEQNRAFDEIFATFATPGWRYLQRELRNQCASAANVRNVKNLDFAQGQVSVLDGVSNWQGMWEALYAGARDGTIEVDPEFGNDPGV